MIDDIQMGRYIVRQSEICYKELAPVTKEAEKSHHCCLKAETQERQWWNSQSRFEVLGTRVPSGVSFIQRTSNTSVLAQQSDGAYLFILYIFILFRFSTDWMMPRPCGGHPLHYSVSLPMQMLIFSKNILTHIARNNV